MRRSAAARGAAGAERHGRSARTVAGEGTPAGSPAPLARSQDVEHQLVAGVGDDSHPECAGLDQPQAVAGRALPDQRAVLPQDEREGERLWAAPHLDRHAAPSAVRAQTVSRPTDTVAVWRARSPSE